MNKKLKIFTTLILAAALLASCKNADGTNIANSGNANLPGTEFESDVIWAYGADVNIVLEDGLEYDVFELSEALYSKTGVLTKYGHESSLKSDGITCEREIVIGNTERPVTKRALYALDKLTDPLEEEYGYVIYAYNGSLGIVYNHEYAFEDAMEYFTENLLSYDTLKLDNGVIKEDSFILREKIAEIRNEKRNDALDELTDELGSTTVKELKELYALYDEEIYIWIANLYDPETGGFYFSNSGRNNQGFLPDLESTVQALRHLEECGMFENYRNNYAKALPDEIRYKILSFAKGLQSSSDGAFYHPQWGTNIIDARRGRDLAWGTDLITKLGDKDSTDPEKSNKPYWNAPDGTLGEYGAPGTATRTVYVTCPLGMSLSSAVSKVVPTAESGTVVLPDHLTSMEKWMAYIDGLNLCDDPYTAGNMLAAGHDMITAAGPEYENYLIDYLNKTQDAETGAWWSEKLTDEYEIANGIMKIVCVYDYLGATIPNAENTLKYVVDIIKKDGDYHICCVYNPWVVIDLVLNNIESSQGEERAEELRAGIRSEAAVLISKTREKISKYAVDGGGFHYHLDSPTHYSQKAHVACATVPEADMNATTISSGGIINYILESLGVDRVSLWYNEDYEYFMGILTELQPVIKDDLPTPNPERFDDYEAQLGEQKFGIEYMPGSYVSVFANDEVAGTLGTDGKSKYFSVNVVNDPSPAYYDDMALKVEQYTYESGSDIAASPITVVFSMENYAMISECYVIDTDMYIAEGKNTFAQLFYYNNAESRSDSFSLNFSGYTLGGKQYLRIYDNYAGLDNEKDTSIVDGIPFNEWFNLRIELYKIYTAEEGDGRKTLEIIAKIYIDDEYVGKSEAARVDSSSNTVVDKTIGAVGFMTYRYTDSEFYLDNTVAKKANKEYVAETVALDPDVVLPEVEGTRGSGVYYNDDSYEGKRFNFRLSRGESEFYSVKFDSDGNKVWGPTTAGKITLTRQEDGAVYFFRTNDSDAEFYANYSGNNILEEKEDQAFVFEQDIVFTGLEKKAQSDVYRLEVNCGPAFGYGFEIHLSEDEDGNIIFDAEKIHVSDGFVGIRQDEWTNLRFEVYGTTSKNTKIKIYVNGEYALTIKPDVWYSTDYSTKVRFWICAPTDDNHGILLDNLFIGSVSKKYVSEEKDIPTADGSHDGGSYYADENASGIKVSFNDGASYNEFYQSNPNGTPTAAKVGEINDENTAMYLIRKNDTGEKFFVGYRNTSITYSSVIEDHAAIVEQDIAFVGLSAGQSKAYYLEIFTGSSDGVQAYIYLGSDADGNIEFSEHNIAHTAEGYTPMKTDVWYNLRFELYPDGLCKVFINGEYSLTLELSVVKTTLNRMEVRYWVCSPLDDNHGLILDNIYIGADSKEYVNENPDTEAPDEDGADTGEEGGETEEPTDPDTGDTSGETDSGDTEASPEEAVEGTLSNGSNIDDEGWD